VPDTRTSAATQSEPISVWWYASALVLYVVIAYFFKAVLLNWIMGPLFLLVALHVIPAAARTIRTKVRARSIE
jgi:hypothetical protein